MPSKTRIAKLIYLTGTRGPGYRVLTSGFDGMLPLEVPTVRVGNAIVRALREEAMKRPDLFPPSAQRTLQKDFPRLKVDETGRVMANA